MFKTAVILFSLITICLSQTETATIENFRWLAGAWITEQGNTVIEEVWMAPQGGMMPGMGRTVFSEDKTFFEFMRIARTDSGIYFFGSPKGENTTPFKLTRTEHNRIEFENPQHDFPQRIIYVLASPDNLTARVEGMVNGKLEYSEWNYRRNTRFTK